MSEHAWLWPVTHTLWAWCEDTVTIVGVEEGHKERHAAPLVCEHAYGDSCIIHSCRIKTCTWTCIRHMNVVSEHALYIWAWCGDTLMYMGMVVGHAASCMDLEWARLKGIYQTHGCGMNIHHVCEHATLCLGVTWRQAHRTYQTFRCLNMHCACGHGLKIYRIML